MLFKLKICSRLRSRIWFRRSSKSIECPQNKILCQKFKILLITPNKHNMWDKKIIWVLTQEWRTETCQQKRNNNIFSRHRTKWRRMDSSKTPAGVNWPNLRAQIRNRVLTPRTVSLEAVHRKWGTSFHKCREDSLVRPSKLRLLILLIYFRLFLTLSTRKRRRLGKFEAQTRG
jgi:hypothetical protein